MAKKGNRGASAFERFYEELFEGRWGHLREALLAHGTSVAFEDRLAAPYYLDAASIAAAEALEAAPGHETLDLCAAPGGKTLVIASTMQLDADVAEPRARLVCNERSSARRARLHRVLDEHLLPAARSRVRVTGHDAARWALHEPAAYDRVLADVPCSSEQHVIRSEKALEEWSPSRSIRLARGAYAIACAGFDALKPGGRMVYSTCALAPAENDGVVARLLKRGRDAIRLASARSIPECAEQTECGWMILPDACRGSGPIYLSVIERA